MKTEVSPRSASAGLSLLELVVALLLFQVGLLAVAGMVLVAQAELRESEGVLRGTLEVMRVGDSLLRDGGSGAGELLRPWGSIQWAPSGPPGASLVIWALAPEGTDTLALLRLSPLPSSPAGPERGDLSGDEDL